MRIGYIPQTEDDVQRVTEAEARFAAAHDLGDLEIDRWGWGENELPWAEEELAIVEEHGLTVTTVGLWGQDYLAPEAAETAEADLQRALSYAERADAEVFVTGTVVPEAMDDEEAWEAGIEFYADLVERVGDRGLTTAFYIGHGEPVLLDSMEAIRRFTEAIPEATLKVDPGNLVTEDIDPLRVFHEFGDRVGHVHVKDVLCLDDGEMVDQCPAGMGDLPWGSFIDLLYLADYDGVLSLEPHWEYWGPRGTDRTRRQGVRIAEDHIAQFLKPEDRPDIGDTDGVY